MTTHDFTTTIQLPNSAAEVFAAVLDPRAWWSQEIAGATDTIGDIFHYHYQDKHTCTIKVIEVLKDKRVVWLVLENNFSFASKQDEWTNTKITFDIEAANDQTQLVFTHVGLVPGAECYGTCSNAWTGYIQHSLKNLITSGKGSPNPREIKSVH